MPPPRSSHQMVSFAHSGGQLWLFGGEFITKSHVQIHHYNDLWLFDIIQQKWEKIDSPRAPSPRSGHRMVAFKKIIVLFGGFFNNEKYCQYFNDLYLFHTENRVWMNIDIKNQKGIPPSPRSAFHFLPYKITDNKLKNITSLDSSSTLDEKTSKQRETNKDTDENEGILLFWGYTVNYGKGSSTENKKNLEVGTGQNLIDMYKLVPDLKNIDKNTAIPMVWRWTAVKQKMGGCLHKDQSLFQRCGAVSVNYGTDRVLLFGGVFDKEQTEELICESVFYNDIYQFDVSSSTWVPFPILKRHINDPTSYSNTAIAQLSKESESLPFSLKRVKLLPKTGENGRFISDEEDLDEEFDSVNLTSNHGDLNNTNSIQNSITNNVDEKKDISDRCDHVRPGPRMKSCATVLRTSAGQLTLFLLGGMIEASAILELDEDTGGKNKKGDSDRTLILDDFYKLDLNVGNKGRKKKGTQRIERCWVQIHAGSGSNRIGDFYSSQSSSDSLSGEDDSFTDLDSS
ncbi:uncharacterized protein LOC135923769 isoform X2 [Gordionus sp. m RMFG-2023]